MIYIETSKCRMAKDLQDGSEMKTRNDRLFIVATEE